MTDNENRQVNGLTFAQWKIQVNRALLLACGLTVDDLPDCDYWVMWADELTPAEMAREVLAEHDYPFEEGE